MKKSALFLFICLFASCNSPEKLICRTWKIEDVTFDKSDGGFGQQIQEQIKKAAVDFKLVFKKDSVYELIKKDGDNKGKWWFSADKKTVTSVTDEVTVNSQILALSKNKLVFIAKDPGGKQMTLTCSPVTNKP